MLKGFEEYTGPLNGFELNTVLPKVARYLEKCRGAENAETNSQLRFRLSQDYNVHVSDPRLRAIINEIRTSDTVPYLVASSKGYYVATSVAGLVAAIHISTLGGFGNKIHTAIAEMSSFSTSPITRRAWCISGRWASCFTRRLKTSSRAAS